MPGESSVFNNLHKSTFAVKGFTKQLHKDEETVTKIAYYTLNISDPEELHPLELGSLPRLLPSNSSHQRRTGCNSAVTNTLWNSTNVNLETREHGY
jgi:hypothetical protein